MELLGGGGAPVGEPGGDWEAVVEDVAEVRRERDVEFGFNVGEFGVGETFGDYDVGGFEAVHEAAGVSGEREAYSFGPWGLL